MSREKYYVLVVEDEPIIQQDAVNEIEEANMGFVVKWTAYNGEDALDIIEKEMPDVVFTDVKMPIMSGMELIEQIRKRKLDIPIVVLSGFSDFDYARQAIKYKVEDYLLKPLESDQLKEVLDRILKKLEKTKKKEDRNILFSKVHGITEKHSLPFHYQNEKLDLYLIQIGNLYHYDFAEEILEQVKSYWKEAEWGKWIVELCGKQDFWVIDEKKPNQKFLIMTHPKCFGVNERLWFAEQLSRGFKEKVPNLPIHIALTNQEIGYQDIWNYSGELRILIEDTKIGDEILLLGEQKKTKNTDFLVSLKNQLKVDVENENLQGIEQGLEKYVLHAVENGFSQKEIEKEIVKNYFFAFEDHQKIPEQDERKVRVELRKENFLQSEICVEPIWKMLEQTYLKAGDKTSLELSIKEIESYIRKYYAANITVAELSKKFHFKGNYLTRVFKKYTGETPVNYLTQVRLDNAIELMKTRKDLDIQNISNMVGYSDSHYFSRIFKNKLGKSPKEYRMMLDEE